MREGSYFTLITNPKGTESWLYITEDDVSLMLVVWWDGREIMGDYETRNRWGWRVLNAHGERLGDGADMWSPLHEVNVETMMKTFISFLLSAAEARDEMSDSWDLFPPIVRNAASMLASALQITAIELDEEE